MTETDAGIFKVSSIFVKNLIWNIRYGTLVSKTKYNQYSTTCLKVGPNDRPAKGFETRHFTLISALSSQKTTKQHTRCDQEKFDIGIISKYDSAPLARSLSAKKYASTIDFIQASYPQWKSEKAGSWACWAELPPTFLLVSALPWWLLCLHSLILFVLFCFDLAELKLPPLSFRNCNLTRDSFWATSFCTGIVQCLLSIQFSVVLFTSWLQTVSFLLEVIYLSLGRKEGWCSILLRSCWVYLFKTWTPGHSRAIFLGNSTILKWAGTCEVTKYKEFWLGSRRSSLRESRRCLLIPSRETIGCNLSML